MPQPAIAGGPRAVPEGLQKSWPPIGDRDREYVLDALESGIHTFGKHSALLEQ